MNLENARKYYQRIKTEFPGEDSNLAEFYDYFESTLLPLENDIKTKFEFDLWSYHGKFEFKGNKKKLADENKLKYYVYFTNNACESFNHLINQCILSNNKVSFNKFEDIIKYVFIRMEGIDNNGVN